MATILRQKKANVDVALRRGRESTYTEPLMKKGEQRSVEEMNELKAYLSDFYKTIYKRGDEIHRILKDHPNTVAAHFSALVPDKMSYEDFWQRYFFRCDEQRLITEWEKAAEKAKELRAAKAEEIQKSISQSLRNIQETLEVASHGLATETSTPPILGPEAPDIKPSDDLKKPNDNEVNVSMPKSAANASSKPDLATKSISEDKIEKKSSISSTTSKEDSKSLVSAPQTASGETTSESPKQSSLKDQVAAANKVERNAPQSQTVQVPPKEEPKVISFWKEEVSRAPETTDAASTRAQHNTTSKKNGDKKADSSRDLKRSGSKISDAADRASNISKKVRKDQSPDESQPEAVSRDFTADSDQAGGDSKTEGTSLMSNTSVMIMVLPVLLALIVSMLFNTDLACAAIQPGIELGDSDIASDAPWWAPDSAKEQAFAWACPSRTRTSLKWTKMDRGRGEPLYKLVLVDLDASASRPILDQRNIRSAMVSPISISYVNKKGKKETMPAPWVL